MIKIYHYSNYDIKDKISPCFFGKNNYTANSKNISPIKRIYFYTDKNIEYYFKSCKFIYTAQINKNKLYDINSNTIKNFKDIYFTAKKQGYYGIIKNNIIVLFYPIKGKKLKGGKKHG